jgi:carboxynorspermidine decarboxylase
MPIETASPSFVLELSKLESNLKKISKLGNLTNIVILHTLKSFHHIDGLKPIDKYLDGFSMGNLTEYEYISLLKPQHIHTYSPYIYPDEVVELSQLSSTMSFNSILQWKSQSHIASKKCSVGLRINPKLNIKLPKYCNPNQSMALGVDYHEFLNLYTKDSKTFSQLEGLHFHALSTSGIDELKYLLAHICKEYKELLPNLKWINLGGGHNFASATYDVDAFIDTVTQFTNTYKNIKLIFEPGEGVMKNSGYFSTTILDIIPSKTPVVILDTSIETHLLDVAITKVSPSVKSSCINGKYKYLLAGMSCIAGDTIGEYTFNSPLNIGEQIIFKDMIAYTMVKQTKYNGIKVASFRVI